MHFPQSRNFRRYEFGNLFAWRSYIDPIALSDRLRPFHNGGPASTISLIALPVTEVLIQKHVYSGNNIDAGPRGTRDMILDNVRIAVLSSVRFNAISAGYLRLRSVDPFDTMRGGFSIVSSFRTLTRVRDESDRIGA